MTHFINKIWQKWCPGLTICYCSVTQSSLTLCDPMDCSMPGFPILHHLPELAKTYAHWVGDIIRPSHPLSPSPPAFNLSHRQGFFQWVGSSYQVAKILELQFQHPSFHECSGWINFRIHWFDALAVQGTLKSLLQHDSSKASILRCSAFSMVQVVQMIKNLPAVQETYVQPVGQEDPPGERRCNPLQYSCLENPMGRGAWWATVHGVAKNQTQLRN